MSDEALTICPHCKKPTLERIVTGGAGVLYKGEGWYVTDYSHKSTGGKDTGAAPAATPANLPATPSPAASSGETKSAEPAAPKPKSKPDADKK
jgi:predicted nucleic acid-binding Zn ribbon protein